MDIYMMKSNINIDAICMTMFFCNRRLHCAIKIQKLYKSFIYTYISLYHRAIFQYPMRRKVRFCEVPKPRDWLFECSHRLEIWRASQQQCYRGSFQISKRSDHSWYKSRGFETLRYFMIGRLMGCWNRALVTVELKQILLSQALVFTVKSLWWTKTFLSFEWFAY